MNKAFRQQNIELMFLFVFFFIQDLSRQVKFEYENLKLLNLKTPIISLYRGQLMSKDEIEKFTSGSGGCLRNNCFFSTSRQPDIRLPCRYFADITHLSYFPHESEILFTIGTEFRKEEVKYNQDEDLWIVSLELRNDYDQHDSREFEITPAKFTISNCLNICTDWDFCVMSSTDSISFIFDGLIGVYPTYEQWILAAQYHSLANYKALKSWKKYKNDSDLNANIDISKVYKNMVYYYDYDNAFINYDKALRIHFELVNEISSYFYNIVNKLLELCAVHKNNYHTELKYQLLKYEYTVKSAAPSSTDNDYTAAENKTTNTLDNYQKALMKYQQELESHHDQFSSLIEEIANICFEHKHNYQLELKHQLTHHEYIVKQSTPDTRNGNQQQIDRKKYQCGVGHINLSDFYVKIHQYDLAKEYLLKALDLYEEVQIMTLEHKTEIINEKLKNAQKFLTYSIRLRKQAHFHPLTLLLSIFTFSEKHYFVENFSVLRSIF
ncbi:unnamed protein product [Rotaria socialis]|uniref:Uncharacterized protein n=1 Tax=Rotaria socialis TaxID=392032 RepID=A0A820GWM2_9BILA|nr:unnamed protein product [Rotaria socialis]